MTSRLRLLLVEDHPVVRAAIRRILDRGELEVVGEASSLDGGLSQALALRPDVILLDIDLAGQSAVPLIPELVRRLPGSTVVVLTASSSNRLLGEVVEAGARGFLTKDMDGPELRAAILGLTHGELAMTRPRARIALEYLAGRLQEAPASDNGLSEREGEILRMIAGGSTDREIAEALVLSTRTVESHVASILRKLGVRNRVEAAVRYRNLASHPGEADPVR